MSWPLAKLSDVCEINIGRTPARANSNYWGKGSPWLSIADMNQGRDLYNTKEQITDLGIKESNIKVVPKGTVLFSFKLSIGKIGITQREMYTNEAIAAFPIIDERILCENYLLYALTRIDATKTTDRAVMGATLNKRKLAELKIPLPPLEEQKHIAAILDKADAIRRKRQQAIDLTDQLLRSVFLDMFGDPVLNPKKWDKQPLEEAVDKVIDCPHSTPKWTENGKVAIRTSNLTAGGWNWKDTRFVSEKEFHERSKRAYVKPDDVILSREGTVGIAAIVEKGMEICLGQRLVQLIPNLSVANSEYVLFILLHELEPERVERIMVGATSKHINVKELRSLIIPIPPLEIQDIFKRRINKIYNTRAIVNRYAEKHKELFDSLIQQAFRGELIKQIEAA